MTLPSKYAFSVIRIKQQACSVYNSALLLVFVFFLFLTGSCKVKPATDNIMDSRHEKVVDKNTGISDSEEKSDEKSASEVSKAPFELLTAWSQKKIPGIVTAGGSTEYGFEFVVLTDEKIGFDSAWIGKNSFKVYLANTSGVISNRPVTIAKNDTVTVRVSFSDNLKPDNNAAPVSYTGAALLSYHLNNGSTNYFEIKSIKNKPAIHGQ